MIQKRFRTSIACLCLILLCIFPLYTLGSTTLGESTFPVEEKREFIWRTVNATESWYMDVPLVKFTVSKIYNETFNEKNYLFLNYTLEFYYKISWVPEYTNSFYMAYNKTLNFLNWSSEGFFNGNLFVFPTPVNLTLIGEAVKKEGTTIYRWELNEEDIIIIIPFENNFLIITIVSIIPLVIFTKKKIANSRKH